MASPPEPRPARRSVAPVVAAAAMVFSSALVLGNALRLLGRGPARLWVPAGAVAGTAAALWALAWWRL